MPGSSDSTIIRSSVQSLGILMSTNARPKACAKYDPRAGGGRRGGGNQSSLVSRILSRTYYFTLGAAKYIKSYFTLPVASTSATASPRRLNSIQSLAGLDNNRRMSSTTATSHLTNV